MIFDDETIKKESEDNALHEVSTPPIVLFKKSLQECDKYLLGGNSLKLATLRAQREFLERLCSFVLEEALLKTGDGTISAFVGYILKMDRDVGSLQIIQNEVMDNIVVQIIVSVVTKINLFGSTSYSKKRKATLVGDYVDWCKGGGIEGSVVPVIKFEDLLIRLKDLQVKKSSSLNKVGYIEAHGRLVQVDIKDITEDMVGDECRGNLDKLGKYFIYTPAGVYAIGDRSTHKLVLWSPTMKHLQSDLCAMLRH